MAFRMTAKTSRVGKQLGKLSADIRTAYSKRYLSTAKGLIAREQNRHFVSQSAPDGAKWKPLSDATLALAKGAAKRKVKSGAQKTARTRRTAKSKILLDTGLLRASVTVDSATGAIREMLPEKLRFGTNLPYARTHQFGATITVTDKMRKAVVAKTGIWIAKNTITIPARPFLGVGSEGKDDLAKAARSTLQAILKANTK